MTHKILLVDDEPELLGSWERILRPLGYACLIASTGTEAMVLIDRQAPDLIVSDLRLPGIDGLAVARYARARLPAILVLLVSADDSDGTRDAAREIGAGAFLAKPFANAAFRQAVERLLASANAGSTDGPGE
jgi:CheY-like chemotaxis protein